jgi:hypothetical protein
MVWSRRLRTALAAVVMFVSVAATPVAVAQNAPETEEEKAAKWSDVPQLEHVKPWKQWMAASLFAIGCLAAAFKNPHRTHLD